MLRKICLLTNFNLYESKRYFTQKLAEAMERHGLEIKIIDARQGVLGADTISAIRNFSPDFTCSFNTLDPIGERRFLWDFLAIPHLAFLVDPAFYSTTLTDSPYSLISCVDRSDCAVIASTGFKNVFFWPHAVERELAPDGNLEKTYDVVFLGSCYDYESLRASWRQRNTEAFNKVLDDAIDIVFSKETLSLGEALVEAWNSSKLDPQGVDFATMYYYLDNYTRGKDRIELIRSIKNAHVHVFGELATDNAVGILSWQQYFASQRNVTVHPPVLFGEAMEIYKRSKIVLNSMPFFRDGTHERIFASLACGCLPITSESKYLHEQFRENEELIFYKAAHRERVNSVIDEWLGNEKKRREAVASGRQKVMKHHTWDNRVQELLKSVPPMLQRIHEGAIKS